MADVNLQEIHDTLLSIAFEAGRMIMAANPNDISTGTKLNCKLLLSGQKPPQAFPHTFLKPPFYPIDHQSC